MNRWNGLSMLRYLIAVACLGGPFGAVAAQDNKGAPKEAKTTADILKGVEAAKGFGTVGAAEFRRADKKTFVVWYNPYSGRAACHVHGYSFDAKNDQWVRVLDRVFEGTHDVSVEVGAVSTIRNVKGEVIYKDKAK